MTKIKRYRGRTAVLMASCLVCSVLGLGELVCRLTDLEARLFQAQVAKISQKLPTVPLAELQKSVRARADETGNYGFPVEALPEERLRETALLYYKSYIEHQRIYEFDPETLFCLRPGTHILNMRVFSDCPTPSEVHINRAGRRGVEPRHRADNCLRIACLGDSVTFGWGVKDGSEYPAVLAQLLTQQGIRVEVANCGVPGFTSLSGVNYFRKYGKELAATFVTLQFGINDGVEFTNSEAETLAIKRSLRFRLIQGLNQVRLFRVLDSLFSIKTQLEPAALRTPVKKPRVSLTEFSANLQRLINDIKAEGGIPILLPVIPKRNQLERVNNPYAAAGVEIARTLSVPLLHVNEVIESHAAQALIDPDLTEDLKELQGCFGARLAENPAYYFFFDSCHLTSIGHVLLARELANLMREILKDQASSQTAWTPGT